MCSQFTVKLSKETLQALPLNNKKLEDVSLNVLPSQQAPILVAQKKKSLEFKLTSMRFSLVPSWSKEAKVKFATHNARIETVLEKPTWKIPFLKQHCLVPLTSFYESVYTGPEAGHVIEFHQENKNLLWAAGIFDYWKASEQESFYSFSIVTTEPDSFIIEHGHDRSPLFLDLNSGLEWLQFYKTGTEQIEFLNLQRKKPELQVSLVRPLKSGWEKRKPNSSN